MSEIIFSSSYDEKNCPENILDSSNKFFCGTGMFPQEVCIQFNEPKNLKSIMVNAYGVKKLAIQTCENDSVVNFTKQAEEKDIKQSNRFQDVKLNLINNPKVKVLKVEVLEGYEDFFAIKSVNYQ